MPSIIFNWRRALASARVHPPATIRTAIGHLLKAEPQLQPLIIASGGEWKVTEIVYRVFMDSIRETNADKAYFLQKLKEQNEMAEALSDYLASWVEVSQGWTATERGTGKNEPYKCQPDQPKSWLVGLPVRHIPVALLNFRR